MKYYDEYRMKYFTYTSQIILNTLFNLYFHPISFDASFTAHFLPHAFTCPFIQTEPTSYKKYFRVN